MTRENPDGKSADSRQFFERFEERSRQRDDQVAKVSLLFNVGAQWESDPAALASAREVSHKKATRPPGSRAYLLHKALQKPLRFWRTLINDHLSSSLAIEAGELGERLGGTEENFLYLLDADRDLVSFAVVAPDDVYYRRIPANRPGIIRLVSESREAYCLREVATDPYYDEFLESTRSQQTAPIFWDGRVLAVHSHESPRPGAFSPISARMHQEDAQARLTGWLLGRIALGQVGRSGHAGYWNPSRHGWDPHEYFQLVLQQTRQRIKEQLEPAARGMADATVFALWLLDPADQVAHTLATTGYSSSYSAERLLQFTNDDVTNELATAPAGTVRNWYPRSDDTGRVARTGRPSLDALMGMKAYRAVTIRPCGAVPDEPGQIVLPGLILTIYAFTEAAERALPSPEDLARVAALLEDQVVGFERNFPILAAAEIRRVLMECRDSSNLEATLSKAMERILAARAVLLYAPPYGSHRDLHLIATTAPLDAPLPREVAPPREQSLRECGHRIGDESVTGRLAAHPGWSVRWTSVLLAASRLQAQGWPDRPSDLNRVLVPRTASRYGRTIACSIADREPERTLGVAWAHRDTDQPPFTAWDELALRDMARAAAEVFYSWRDWHRIARARGMPAEPAREWLFLPPPRPDVFSLRSFAHEVAAVAHELAKGARLQVLQAAVLVEPFAPSDGPRNPRTVAWYSEILPEELQDPRFEWTAGPGRDWTADLDRGEPWIFSDERKAGGFRVRAGVRIPWMAWVGRHVARGVIAVDLYRDDPILAPVMDDLRHAARKLTAGLTIRGTSLRLEAFLDPDGDEGDLIDGLRDQLGARAVALDLGANGRYGDDLPVVAEEEWGLPVISSPWLGKGVSLDADANAWGLAEVWTSHDYLLRVPVRSGMKIVGHITLVWPAEPERVLRGCDSATLRAGRIRDAVAAWSLWSSNREAEVRPPMREDEIEVCTA